MADLEVELHTGGLTRDTIYKVAEKLRTFWEVLFSVSKLLRQIGECTRLVDAIETRHFRKDFIFVGVLEVEKKVPQLLFWHFGIWQNLGLNIDSTLDRKAQASNVKNTSDILHV